jgi:hypothetical protein
MLAVDRMRKAIWSSATSKASSIRREVCYAETDVVIFSRKNQCASRYKEPYDNSKTYVSMRNSWSANTMMCHECCRSILPIQCRIQFTIRTQWATDDPSKWNLFVIVDYFCHSRVLFSASAHTIDSGIELPFSVLSGLSDHAMICFDYHWFHSIAMSFSPESTHCSSTTNSVSSRIADQIPEYDQWSLKHKLDQPRISFSNTNQRFAVSHRFSDCQLTCRKTSSMSIEYPESSINQSINHRFSTGFGWRDILHAL